MNYEWLPDSALAWKKRREMADKLNAEADALESAWLVLPAPTPAVPCGCLNLLADRMNQKRKLAREMMDRRRRMVPIVR